MSERQIAKSLEALNIRVAERWDPGSQNPSILSPPPHTHTLYSALQGTTKEHLPQVKLGETLNLRLFGVCF